jgi:hypothetical protein
MSTEKTTKLAVFEGNRIRKILHEGEWWFVVEDVVLALIESRDPKQYIQRMKQRDPELSKGWVQIVRTLSILTEGGPQKLNCAKTEGIFRLLTEATTTKIHRDRDSQWMAPLKKDAQDGGAVAGRTRKDIEAQTGQPVISADNFKQLSARKPKKLNAGGD